MLPPYTYTHAAPKKTAKKMPAIFFFHGYTQDENKMAYLLKDFKESHHIFSLRGPYPLDKGYGMFHLERRGVPVRETFDACVAYAQAFVHQALATYDIDPGDITLAGFSQGAVIAMTLALTMGQTIRRVVALSGYLPPFVIEEDYGKVPVDHLEIFISHGVKDAVVPFARGELVRDFFLASGARVTFMAYAGNHVVSPDNRRDLVTFISAS